MSDVVFQLFDESAIVQIWGDTGALAPFVDAAAASAAAALASELSAEEDAGDAAGYADAAGTSAAAAEASRILAAAAALTAPNVYASTAAGLAAVGEGITFWVDAGSGAIDLYRDIAGVATRLGRFGTGPSRTLTSFGAIGDARMVENGEMTAASATLTSATLAFTSADVGKSIIVGGAGPAGAKLKTTILSRTSATQVVLAAAAATTVSGAGVALGTDCSAAWQAALTALDVARGGTLVIDGYFLLTEPVSKAFFSTLTSASVRIAGSGTDSAIIIGVDANETAISLSNAGINITSVSFVGLPDATDAQRVFYFNGVVYEMDQCQFLGLATTDQVVRATASWGKTRKCLWGGSFCLSDGIGGVSRAPLYMDDWYSYEDDSSQFLDYGFWRGLQLGKSGVGNASAWVGIGTPNTSHLTAGARAAGVLAFKDSRFDEGTQKGIWVQPASGTITSLELIGTRHNVNDVANASGVYADSVEDVRIDRCVFGLAPSDGTVFGEFVDCGRVLIDAVDLLQGVSGISATNVGAVIVRDTDIDDFTLSSSPIYFEDSTAGSFPWRVAGAVTDASFPVAPGRGQEAWDSTTGRIYIRGGGDWGYIALTGGSLLGPELVTNGTGLSTTGWTAGNGAALSVLAGNLRVTNTVASGYATQAIAVTIGQQYVVTVGGVAGSRFIRVGSGPTEAEIAAAVDSSVSATTFTAAFTPIHITCISTGGGGATADFDNISLRAA